MSQNSKNSEKSRESAVHLEAPWVAPHARACEAGEPLYQDPESGLWVFTQKALKDRGYCCHSGCRHCPYPD